MPLTVVRNGSIGRGKPARIWGMGFPLDMQMRKEAIDADSPNLTAVLLLTQSRELS